MKRYDGWNEHRFAKNWYCRGCGRMQWKMFRAWYRNIHDGPYCLKCRDKAEYEETRGALTRNPSVDTMTARGRE